MENMKEFVKYTKIASRIFIGIWLFMCVLMTLSCLVGSSKENIASDTVFLIICYILFSAMLLVPAITITQAQRAKVSEACYSQKSYWITLLLAIFLGTFGIHRFYTGRKLTGILYLLTLGGVGIGWMVDIILVATGMFLDQEGNIIQRAEHRKQEHNIRPQSVEVSEVPKDSKKLQVTAENQTVKSTLFSDIVIPGDTEKKQEIPVMPSGQDTFCEKPSFSVTISATKTGENEVSLYTTRSYSDNSCAKFFSDMKKYADTVGQKAEFVPFMQYWPTYDSMDRRQRAWYFYWRTQVRNGEYPDTDLSYIFVHIYELLSGCGWKQASD